MAGKKQKYLPIVNGAADDDNPQIELVDRDESDDEIQRGPSQFNTKMILDTVATPRSKGKQQCSQRPLAEVQQQLPVKDRIWNKLNKAVYWVFLGLGLAAIIFMVLGITTGTVSQWISMLVIIGITLAGSFLGMWATYLTGTFEEFTEKMKKENGKFEYNIDQLTSTRGELKQHTKGVFFEVKKLGRDAKELDVTLQQYDELRKDLESLGAQNAEVNKLVDDVNNAFDGMVEVISNNERASLLSIYYEVSCRDDEKGLSSEEYNRFLGRLNQKTKQLFEDEGSFKELAGEDDIIDLQEFEALLDVVIEKQEQSFLDKHLA